MISISVCILSNAALTVVPNNIKMSDQGYRRFKEHLSHLRLLSSTHAGNLHDKKPRVGQG